MSAKPRRIDFREGVDPGRLKDRIDFLEKKMAELLERVEDQENDVCWHDWQKGPRGNARTL